MLTQLQGARTYILAVLLAAVGLYMSVDDLGTYLGWFDLPNVSEGLLALLGGGTAATLRAGMKP